MASEIRVDKITSLSGVGTITPSSSGIDITGITTVATLKATTGIVTTLTATTGIVTTLTANTVTSLGDVDIADSIIHTGDTNTKIRFPAADNISFEVAGTERLRIDDSDGVIAKHTTAANLRVQNSTAAASQVAQLDMAPANGLSGVQLKCTSEEDFSTGANRTAFFTLENRKDGTFYERLRIASDGKVGINSTSPSNLFTIESTDNNQFAIKSGDTNADIVLADTGGSARVRHTSTTFEIWTGGAAGSYFAQSSARRMQIDNSGNTTLNTGNLVIGTAGKGIDFSAAANAGGMSNEVLDDYEEGTWTPSLNGVTEPSWHQQVGTYTKIGSLVHLDMWLQASSTTTSTSAILVDLPFAASNANASRPTTATVRVYSLRNWGSYSSALGFVTSGNADINMMWVQAGSNPASMGMNIWQNGAELHASITYNTYQ